MIRFDNVSKTFGTKVNALSQVTVEINDGEFVFLIGPSGAGKTTMLRLIIRDLLPNEGAVWVDEWNLSKLPKTKIHLLRRHVGMVFQDFKILTDRTLKENVSLGLEILEKNPEEIRKRVNDILDLVDLSDKQNLFPQQLSAGELQRASIARAIVGGPKILLADEPTGNLDPENSWGILEVLEEINKMGTTVIMSTHNSNIVNDMKKRTIVLEHGKLVSDELKGHYKVSSHKKRT